MANLEAKMSNSARIWERLGGFFGILGAIFPKLAKTNKNDDSKPLLKVFWDLGALLEAMLAHVGALLGFVGPFGRHLGAT